MNGLTRFSIVALIALICYCNATADSGEPVVKLSDAEQTLVESSNRFGLKLFHAVARGEGGNIFISPLSVSYALAMTLNGADGGTRDAISSTLELDDMPIADINASFKNLTPLLTGLDPLVTFEIANSIWYRSGLPVSRKFIDLNKTNFQALVRDLNFGAPSSADMINEWVNNNTNGKINKIISPPIDPSTIMFLINAIYFKGSWSTKFDPAVTRDQPFYPAKDKETTCRMMTNTAKFDYMENDLFQAISLPYGDRGFGMTVFLPRPTISVDDLIDRLNEQNWAIWQKGFFHTKVKFGLPRFKFEYDVTMNDALKAMGMAIAFYGDKANFGNMVNSGTLIDRNIFIDQVKHKTFLQVDEEGTEAAAVTSVTMALTSSAPMPTPVMIVDRPFLFIIQEKNSGSVVFIGKVTDPIWQE